MILSYSWLEWKNREKPQGKREIFAEGIGTSSNLIEGKKNARQWTIRKHGSVGNLSKFETCAGAVTNKGRDIHKLTLDLGAHGDSGGRFFFLPDQAGANRFL